MNILSLVFLSINSFICTMINEILKYDKEL